MLWCVLTCTSLKSVPLPNEVLLAQTRQRHPNRRNLVIAPGTQRRLRVRLDTSSLYEAGAHPRACFAVGATYSLPAAGCSVNCHGTCRQEDVVTPERRDRFIALVQRVLDDFAFLDVVGDAPRLSPGVGVHVDWYRRQGHADQIECARDCRMLNGLNVSPSLCEGGFNDTAVVIALVATARVAGVAASAGPCAYDSGRPVIGVVNWHQPLPSASTPIETLVHQHGGLLRHELFHALGFLFSSFYAANLVVSRGDVWYFRADTRAAHALRQHVNCSDASIELPLMVEPEAGAHSHFPTRLLHDEVFHPTPAPTHPPSPSRRRSRS